MISNTSGLAGIAYWINENYQLSANEAITKQDPLVLELKKWIDAQFEGGRVSSLSTHEMEEKIEQLTNGRLARL